MVAIHVVYGMDFKDPLVARPNGHRCVKSVMRKMCSVCERLKYAFGCKEVYAHEDLEHFL